MGDYDDLEQKLDAAIAERDRLRRELEALRDELRAGKGSRAQVALGLCTRDCGDRLDAILRGGE